MTGRADRSLLDPKILRLALLDSLRKLDPRIQVRNPVMFVVQIGAVITTAIGIAQTLGLGESGGQPAWFALVVASWLWLTVIFANLAEALAEGRGKAQADTLRAMRTDTIARLRDGGETPAAELRPGHVVIVEAGELIPGDGTVIAGIASVDESAITGESAPVIREAGGDRSAVTGGTRVLSDGIHVEITQEPGSSFLDRMIALVEGTARRKTPNEVALGILLAGLSIVFLVVVVTLRPFVDFAGSSVSTVTLIALLVALIPTTIGALLSAIGIAGMDRLIRHNVLALSGRAVEASGDVDVLLLDKTGTITLGNRQATVFLPLAGVDERELAEAARLASHADQTPEGRSIVALAEERFGGAAASVAGETSAFVPFSAHTRMSGVDIEGPRGAIRSLRKGAGDAVTRWVDERRGHDGASTGNGPGVPGHGGDAGASEADPARADVSAELRATLDRVGQEGGTPLAVADGTRILGVVYLKDIVKPGMRERFDRLRAMGIRTIMVTGDNPLTAATIGQEAGVDQVLAEATPDRKLALIREQQEGGRLVAMTGDGTNDAPALAQADVGVAMSAGTQAAREAGNMVDLDSNPTKLIEIVEVGKQLLITRGAMTTFSIANDIAKYFAILPAIFAGVWSTTLTVADRSPRNGTGMGTIEGPARSPRST